MKIKETGSDSVVRLREQVDELVEALRGCITQSGAMAGRGHEYAMRRLAAINDVVHAAIAKAGKGGE